MSGEYFVMLLFPNGNPSPMMDGEIDGESVAFYPSYEAAEIDASQNPVGSNYGFEIFRIGSGKP